MAIPRLNTELYVVEGTDAADLRRGPGHLEGTAMPGEAGNCVIAGHRDTHFRILRQIRPGDSIILETQKGRFCYRVRHARVVSPENTASLRPSHDGLLHLITCYPFYYVGAAPKRMIIEAQLTPQ
jgi:sortase A